MRYEPCLPATCQDGDPTKPKVKVPEGFSFEIYNRNDIENIMARPSPSRTAACATILLIPHLFSALPLPLLHLQPRTPRLSASLGRPGPRHVPASCAQSHE